MKKKSLFPTRNIPLILILVAGFLLRAVNLNQSFWLDEAAQMMESTRTFWEQFQVAADFHPPLYHLMLFFWLKISITEIWARLPSVFFSLGSIFYIYKIARKLFDEKIAIWSSFFLSISPFYIWYSQEARPYMLFSFMALLSTYFLLSQKWILYIFFSVLSLYSSYFAPFLFIGQLFTVFIFERKNWQKIIISQFLIFLFFLPWLPKFFEQLQIGTGGMFSGWSDVVSMNTLKAVQQTFAKFIFGKGSIENNYLYLLVILPSFLIWLFAITKKYKCRNLRIILILFFIPFMTSAFINLFVPVLAPQRLMFLLPMFYLIFSAGSKSFNRNLSNIAFTVMMITSIAGLFNYFVNPKIQRENWRKAVHEIESDPENNKISLFIFPTPFAPYLWYSQKVPGYGIAPQFIFKKDDLANLEQRLTGKKKLFLFQYLTGLTDKEEQVRSHLKQKGFTEVEIKNFEGVGFIYVFEKI